MTSLQLIATNSTNFAFAIYFAKFKPHKKPLLNRMEIMNEATIMISGIHYLGFTEAVEDAKVRSIFGYS